LSARVAAAVPIPVFGNGDLVEASQVLERWRSSGVAGVLVGRGVLRNPWICAQAAALAGNRPGPVVTRRDRARFLLDYIALLLGEAEAEPAGFRHQASGAMAAPRAASARRRWVVNKVRALAGWYTKGFDNGARLREAINATESIEALRDLICAFFQDPGPSDVQTSGPLPRSSNQPRISDTSPMS